MWYLHDTSPNIPLGRGLMSFCRIRDVQDVQSLNSPLLADRRASFDTSGRQVSIIKVFLWSTHRIPVTKLSFHRGRRCIQIDYEWIIEWIGTIHVERQRLGRINIGCRDTLVRICIRLWSGWWLIDLACMHRGRGTTRTPLGRVHGSSREGRGRVGGSPPPQQTVVGVARGAGGFCNVL